MSQLSNMISEIVPHTPRKDQIMFSIPVPEAKEASLCNKMEGRNGRRHMRSTCAIFDKQYYGPSSLMSLIAKICSSLQDCVKSEEDFCMNDRSDSSADGSLQECMIMMDGMAKSLEEEKRIDQSSDGRPLSLPPQELLEDFLQIYFDHINWTLPLFHKDTFLQNVRRTYELGPEANNAWILCFNSIMLLILNNRAPAAPKNGEDPESILADDTMAADLIKPLHANFKRGLNELQSLLEPSLVNVQALILMVCPIFQRRACSSLLLAYLFNTVFDRSRELSVPTFLAFAPPGLLCSQIHWPSSARYFANQAGQDGSSGAKVCLLGTLYN